jgi:hypothetical protein
MVNHSAKMSFSVSVWAMMRHISRCALRHWQQSVPEAILARLPSGSSLNVSEDFIR